MNTAELHALLDEKTAIRAGIQIHEIEETLGRQIPQSLRVIAYNRAFDDAHYKKMIISFITEYGSASRKDIDNLLLDKLSDALDEQQKKNKVRNLIYAMANKDNTIVNKGSSAKPHWVLTSNAI
ncbi:MAG: hypothetical protein NTY86_08180 [Deltaproteobacteria bacterium]|nr:hypothetical protein [Deltaproteobacteria bacterium]